MAHSDSGFWPRASGITGRRALALAAFFAAQPAAAFWNDRLEVYASENITWDSNVFRISKNLDPNATIGNSRRGDRISVTAVGANLDIPVSLQRFQAGYSWFATRYQRFEQLDFNGHAARVNWLWAFTPEVTGDLGMDDSRSLANFAVFSGTTPDVLKSRNAFASADWRVTPSWIAHAGANAAERRHEDPARRVNDIDTQALELRMSYESPQENRIGLAVRREEGKSPRQSLLQGLPFDNSYTQDSVGVVGRWTVSGHSRFDARLDYVRREYEHFTSRDYSGPTFRGSYSWTPTGKLTVLAILRREINPLDDIQTSFVLVTGATVRTRWEMSEKLSLLGTLDYSRWEYRGNPLAGQDYRHNVRGAGVSLAYRPVRAVQLEAGYLREVRSSNLLNADYEDNIATFSARIGF